METLVRDTHSILTTLLRIKYIPITDVFHESLTEDLRLKKLHSNHVLPAFEVSPLARKVIPCSLVCWSYTN